MDAANPALMMVQGLAASVRASRSGGDAALAGDVDWLFENLRWDMQDDLARLVGDMPAREIGTPRRSALAGALRAMVRRRSAVRRPASAEPPAR